MQHSHLDWCGLMKARPLKIKLFFFDFLAHYGTRQRQTQLPCPLTLSPRTLLAHLACRPAYSFHLDLQNSASDLNLRTRLFFKIILTHSELFFAFHSVTNNGNQSRTASFPCHWKMGTCNQTIVSGAAVLAVGGGLCRALIYSLQHQVGWPEWNEMQWVAMRMWLQNALGTIELGGMTLRSCSKFRSSLVKLLWSSSWWACFLDGIIAVEPVGACAMVS